jgi:hypothetical protein
MSKVPEASISTEARRERALRADRRRRRFVCLEMLQKVPDPPLDIDFFQQLLLEFGL